MIHHYHIPKGFKIIRVVHPFTARMPPMILRLSPSWITVLALLWITQQCTTSGYLYPVSCRRRRRDCCTALFVLSSHDDFSNSLHADTKRKIASSIAKGERRAQERNVQQVRNLCSHCHRPPVQCVCDTLPSHKISTQRADILILQHPAEFRRKTFSTVPLLPLVLEHVSIFVGRSFDLATTPPIQ